MCGATPKKAKIPRLDETPNEKPQKASKRKTAVADDSPVTPAAKKTKCDKGRATSGPTQVVTPEGQGQPIEDPDKVRVVHQEALRRFVIVHAGKHVVQVTYTDKPPPKNLPPKRGCTSLTLQCAEALAETLKAKYSSGFSKEQLRDLKKAGGDELLSPRLAIPPSVWGAAPADKVPGAVGEEAQV